jgi:hypothetical protein
MSSRFIGFRVSRLEAEQLIARARLDESTLSEVIREALYQRYGIGSLTQPATAVPAASRRRSTTWTVD